MYLVATPSLSQKCSWCSTRGPHPLCWPWLSLATRIPSTAEHFIKILWANKRLLPTLLLDYAESKSCAPRATPSQHKNNKHFFVKKLIPKTVTVQVNIQKKKLQNTQNKTLGGPFLIPQKECDPFGLSLLVFQPTTTCPQFVPSLPSQRPTFRTPRAARWIRRPRSFPPRLENGAWRFEKGVTFWNGFMKFPKKWHDFSQPLYSLVDQKLRFFSQKHPLAHHPSFGASHRPACSTKVVSSLPWRWATAATSSESLSPKQAAA